MTVAYCSRNQFAERHGYANWAAYVAAGHTAPDPEVLDAALEDATDIMNDSAHMNCLSTNITDANYTQRLERICFDMGTRIMDVKRARSMQGGGFMFSLQDFLFKYERDVLIEIGIAAGRRTVGGVST